MYLNDEKVCIKICNKTSDFICWGLGFIIPELIFLVVMPLLNRGYWFSIIWFVFMLFVGYGLFSYVIHIKGTEIYGRLESGKKFRFDCSDIRRITFKHYNSTHRTGKMTLLIIETDDVNIPIQGSMKGYKECVEYLMEMQRKGIISQKSISSADMKALKQAKAGKEKSRR